MRGIAVVRKMPERWILAIILLLAFVMGLAMLDILQIGTYMDDALYILLAEGLVRGQGFVEFWHPIPIPHGLAPPGYPILLAPMVLLFPGNLEILRVVSFVSVFAGLGLFWCLLRASLPYRTSGLILGVTVLSSQILGLTGQIMTEGPFLALSMASLVTMQSYQEADSEPKRWLFFALSVLAGLLSYAVRTIGLSLGAAIVAYLVARRDLKRAAIAGGCFALGVGLWALRNTLVGLGALGYGFGMDEVAQQVTYWANVAANLNTFGLTLIPNALVPIFGPNIAAALARHGLDSVLNTAGALISFLVLAGLAVGIIRTRALSYFYLLSYFGLLLLAPADMLTSRNLIPVVPLMYMCFLDAAASGERMVASRVNSRAIVSRQGALVIGLAGMVMLLNVGRSVQAIVSPVRERIPDVTVGTTWIEANSAKDAVVMVHWTWERPAALYTRRSVVRYFGGMTGEEILREAVSGDVTHILVTPPLTASADKLVPDLDEAAEALLGALQAQSGHPFVEVFANSQRAVYVFARSN